MLRRTGSRKVARAGIIAIALSSSAPVFAGANQFSQIGPDGGSIIQVLIHPTMPSIAYALTSGGYYRSTDAGLTWRQVGENLEFAPADLAVDPTDPNRVIVVVPAVSPLVSTDAGATLAQVGSFPIPGGAQHIEFSADGTAVYTASNNRIARSTDGGRNWSERTPVTANSSSGLMFLHVDPLDANVVYVRDLNAGGLRSVDGGGTWQAFNLPAFTIDIAITSTTPQRIWAASQTGVYSSTNGGTTWTPATLPPSTPPAAALSIALDPTNQSIVYVGTSPLGLLRSPDGIVFTNVHGNARIGQITSIAINRSQPANLMLGGVAGIVATTTSGGTWVRRTSGIFSASAGDMSVAAASSRIYIATSNAGVHFLADGVARTTPVDNDALQQLQQGVVRATTFALLAQARGPDRLFVGISDGYVRSNDAGDTWQSGTTGGGDTVMHFASSPGNPDLIVASTSPPGMYRSIDGGEAWLPASAGLPPQSTALALAFATTAPATVYAAIESLDGNGDCCIQHGVYRSLDSGANWSAANTGFTSSHVRGLAVDPANAQVVYAAANVDRLLKTTNGGASWSQLQGAPSQVLGVVLDPELPNIVYVASINQVARSIDAGLTWQDLRPSSARPEWQQTALLADPRRASTLLMSTHSHGVAEMTIAPNLALESGGSPINPLQPGAQQTYRYRLRNLGPFHATGARAVVTLPAGTTGISATTTSGSCVVQGITVNCTSPVLLTDAVAEINVSATHSALGTIEVAATTIGDQPDSSAANNELRYTVTVAQAVVNPPPSGGGGGGGGGGGTSSLLYVLSLAMLSMVRRRIKARGA
jgi:uncharacterized repeat protein (TIGR01451 family)